MYENKTKDYEKVIFSEVKLVMSVQSVNITQCFISLKSFGILVKTSG
jgi:hypothetical protein